MRRLGGTVSGALANVAAQGFPFLLMLVVTPVLLRALGREQYGALVLFNLVPQIASQLDLGLSSAATRGFAQYCARGERSLAMRLFREAFILLGAWGVVLGAALYLVHAHLADALNLASTVGDQPLVYVAVALNVPLSMLTAATLVPMRALEQYGRAARITVAGGVVYWSTSTIWALAGATLADLVALSTAIVFITGIALFVAFRRSTGRAGGFGAHDTTTSVDSPPTGSLMRAFLPQGAAAFVSQASSLATYHADKLLVSALLSPATAGAYAICTNIANKTLFVIASSATFTFPRSAHLHASGDTGAVAAVYLNTSRVFATLAMCALVPMLGLTYPFLSLWLGAAFADDYSAVLRLLAIGYALTACSVVASNVTMGIGNNRISAVFSLLGGALTVVFLLLLTPRFGVAGAAIASLIGMSQTIVFNVLVARGLGRAAVRASWPLLIELASVGAPIAILIGLSSAFVHSWPALAALTLATCLVFPVAWCVSFGRRYEWQLIRKAIPAGWS